MTNLERFELTINWQIPDRLMTLISLTIASCSKPMEEPGT
jgi:hypothetical protein